MNPDKRKLESRIADFTEAIKWAKEENDQHCVDYYEKCLRDLRQELRNMK